MIAFIGLSHLGIVSGIATAAQGFDVVGFDPNKALCAGLRAGALPISEPGLSELFEANRSRLEFISDPSVLARCELIFISLDVPTDSANRSDLAPMKKMIGLAASHIAPTATVVVLCQVPPGFTRSLAKESRPLGGALYYQVETLIFGNAVERAMKPERYIIGCAEPGAPLPTAYRAWLDSFSCPVLEIRYESAELAKLAINCFLVSSVTTTNTLAEICERAGAVWHEIVPALRLDKRIGPHAYLSPGLGIAGGNLERDLVTVQTLAAEYRTEAGVVSAWQTNSRHRRDWPLRQVQELVLSSDRMSQPCLAIWGLAYKQDTHSVKNSPALALAESLTLVQKTAYDPRVKSLRHAVSNLSLAPSALDACRNADALIIMTPWREFSSVDPAAIRAQMRGNVLIDPFGVLDAQACRAAGFSYHQLGS